MSIFGTKKDGTKLTVNDELQRIKLIEFFKKAYDWELKSNKKVGLIDLLFVDGRRGGIEIEEAQVNGIYWNNKNYIYNSFLRNGNPPCSKQTLNIPPRKLHYWMNGEHCYPSNGNYWYTEIDAEYNMFVRSNIEVTHVMIVMPEIILSILSGNKEMGIISSKEARGIRSSDGVELWTGVYKDYVINWYLENGEWINK